MKNKNRRLHPQELKRRSQLTADEKLAEWKKTREGKRQLAKLQ